MKKKQKKAKKTQKHFDKISCGELTNSFPKQLKRDDLFSTPIWYAYEPAFVKKFNKIIHFKILNHNFMKIINLNYSNVL